MTMGWNSTVVILHDALYDIEQDPEFGKRLAHAILNPDIDGSRRKTIWARHGNTAAMAAEVICSYHADTTLTVRVGGNTGEVVPTPPPQPAQRPRATLIEIDDEDDR